MKIKDTLGNAVEITSPKIRHDETTVAKAITDLSLAVNGSPLTRSVNLYDGKTTVNYYVNTSRQFSPSATGGSIMFLIEGGKTYTIFGLAADTGGNRRIFATAEIPPVQNRSVLDRYEIVSSGSPIDDVNDTYTFTASEKAKYAYIQMTNHWLDSPVDLSRIRVCEGEEKYWVDPEDMDGGVKAHLKNAEERIGKLEAQIVTLTQEEYNLIEIRGENTIYIVVDGKHIYVGDNKIF